MWGNFTVTFDKLLCVCDFFIRVSKEWMWRMVPLPQCSCYYLCTFRIQPLLKANYWCISKLYCLSKTFQLRVNSQLSSWSIIISSSHSSQALDLFIAQQLLLWMLFFISCFIKSTDKTKTLCCALCTSKAFDSIVSIDKLLCGFLCFWLKSYLSSRVQTFVSHLVPRG